MAIRFVLIAAVLFLSACAMQAERVRVETKIVEVPVIAEVPADIKAYDFPDKPLFIKPDEKEAVVGLDKENVQILRELIFSFYSRVCQLEKYNGIRDCTQTKD